MSVEQAADTGSSHESAWVKSSYSGSDGGNCIEVAVAPERVHVRDSKDPSGPVLTVSPEAWASFVAFAATHAPR
ncbi:DUF397 domain-containing protein [Streptomyces sp. WAC 06738]|uniref:DUF397 domain-containing protein n=1 Tax=Streptomyces sp. WAC 06738 TaxID=2203210 RepID=UPI000F6BE389|nr:DUF397 domain-containing protein [Streptomyces sp. WAC 06738]AZM45434.1 DUF397 domain-containing protein [Streptomyces sp. WAC 06738]